MDLFILCGFFIPLFHAVGQSMCFVAGKSAGSDLTSVHSGHPALAEQRLQVLVQPSLHSPGLHLGIHVTKTYFYF